MPLDPQVRRYLQMAAILGEGPPTLESRRAGLDGLGRLTGPPVPVAAVEPLALPGAAGLLPARLYRPLGRADGACLLYFHGGGFVGGGLAAHDGIYRALAAASGCTVLAATYRLAPEHPFPAAVEDARAALAWVAGEAVALGLAPGRLAVGGDSAGANLAAGLCLWARGRLAVAAQLLLCPVLDAAGEGESHRTLATGYGLDRATLARDIAHYVGRADPADPRLSPLRAPSLAGLPPTLIHTAAYDMVRDDGTAYAARLAAEGVPVRHTCHPGMIHHFYGMGGLIPYAREALRGIGAELREALDAAPATPARPEPAAPPAA